MPARTSSIYIGSKIFVSGFLIATPQITIMVTLLWYKSGTIFQMFHKVTAPIRANLRFNLYLKVQKLVVKLFFQEKFSFIY